MFKIAVLVFEGGVPSGTVNEQMQPVRRAACLDTLEILTGLSEYYEPIILATNYPDLAEQAAPLGVQIVTTPREGSFHLGEWLLRLTQPLPQEAILYLSGAGSPLLSREEFIAIAEDLTQNEKIVLTNNVQSSDIVGWRPRQALEQIELPVKDNSLGFLLRKDAGLPRKLLPHSVGVHFDIDTPADILILKQTKIGGQRMQKAVAAIPWDSSNYQRMWDLYASRSETVPRLWMSGRIGGPVMQHINTYIVTRLRVVSEERGMQSMGSESSVCSFVGSYLEHLGTKAFFDYLEKVADVALIDTRPLQAHFRVTPNDNDRFSSDLLQWQDIQEPWLREFTQGAAECRIPVLLGGHTLILGGIWAFVDALRAARLNDNYL